MIFKFIEGTSYDRATRSKCIIMLVWGRGYHSAVRQETKYVSLGSLRSICQDVTKQEKDFEGRNAYEGQRRKNMSRMGNSSDQGRRGEGSRIVQEEIQTAARSREVPAMSVVSPSAKIVCWRSPARGRTCAVLSH